MGTQLEVYLTPNDEQELIEQLQEQCSVIIHRSVYYKEDERLVPSLASLGKYPTDQQVGLTVVPFLDSLVTAKFPGGHTRLNIIYSPVIEFGRSVQEGDIIHPGRFWYQLGGAEKKKRDDFKKWSTTVFRQLKKTLVARPSQIERYLGREAATLSEGSRVRFRGW